MCDSIFDGGRELVSQILGLIGRGLRLGVIGLEQGFVISEKLDQS